MKRSIHPEILDSLPASDPLAIHSRSDLRRLNVIMNHPRILKQAILSHLDIVSLQKRRLQLIELGAGDGTLLLKLARRLSPKGIQADAILIDRQSLLTIETRKAFESLGWSVQVQVQDLHDWMKKETTSSDMILANLFLHHFQDSELPFFLEKISERSPLFIACEPRRDWAGMIASKLLGVIGCNSVTRHDAQVSVQAGFQSNELSLLWPKTKSHAFSEKRAGLFSHLFIAYHDA
ncbi:MAG: class I SAM-dependent methyltransferase [Verrucomicrobiota bacterium]